MKTLHRSDGEAFLVSDELESRLSHLTQDDAHEYPECTVMLSEGSKEFSILGWDSSSRSLLATQISVLIKIERSDLRCFFDQPEPVPVEMFGRNFEVVRTDATLERGVWTARLYLDRLDGDI